MANEKRLIDANTVIQSLVNYTPMGWGKDVPHLNQWWHIAVQVKDNFLKAINEAPTVDAVEVVRCGECWAYNQPDCPMNGSPGKVSVSDFCSYGERRAI